ncbi:DUF1570 domain-containing protein [Kiritimatiellota bacterium B12222]|nr:DUF1570 domain-containing protein [Kiritimatiellota bacterium B12222]
MSLFHRSKKRSPKAVWFYRIFFWFRLISLLAIMGAAYQLVTWSHNYDPRFYQFLGTAPGKALSNLMEWPNLYNRDMEVKNIEDYNDDEKKWHRTLINRFKKTRPTHTLFLKNDLQHHVQIVSRTATDLRVREHFGGKGQMERLIPLSDIVSLKIYDEPLPDVTLRDIRFQMEFPDFHLTYFGHYTVLSDAPYFQVAASVQALEKLHANYMDLLGPLIRFPQQDHNLQILFFSNESEYRNHQQNTAPELSHSVGYYSPLEDRMVVFNQQYSDRIKRVQQNMGDDVDELMKLAQNPQQRQQILKMQQLADKRLRDHAQSETIATLRHEGAHHLSYTYGVHSWIHIENAWLIEGLATYFEVSTPGSADGSYLETLFRLSLEERIPSLSALVEIRQPENFERELPGIEGHEAYALSWSLFHFCMTPENRNNFLGYLADIQDPNDIAELMSTPRSTQLAQHLGMSTQELQTAWMNHIQTLLNGDT